MNQKKSFFEFALSAFSDDRGLLVPTEFDHNFPFIVQRVYFLKNVPPNTTRGAHCHFIEEEVFVCIQGECRALIDQDGTGKKVIRLDSPEKAIYVSTKVWHEFDSFSKDAVLLAFSSTHYLPGKENYEAEYERFLELKKKEEGERT